MPTFVALLMGLSVPLVKKVLIALGVGVLSYAGFSMIADQLKEAIINQWGQLGAASYQYLSLAGVPTALGILLGGFTAKAALLAVGKLGMLSK